MIEVIPDAGADRLYCVLGRARAGSGDPAGKVWPPSADGMDCGGDGMLVISRKSGEKVRIGEEVAISILEISGSRVVLGIEAPREIPVRRLELGIGQDGEVSPRQEGTAPLINRVAPPVADVTAPARVAPPFEYPTRAAEESASHLKKTPVVRVRRTRKITLPTDPAAD